LPARLLMAQNAPHPALRVSMGSRRLAKSCLCTQMRAMFKLHPLHRFLSHTLQVLDSTMMARNPDTMAVGPVAVDMTCHLMHSKSCFLSYSLAGETVLLTGPKWPVWTRAAPSRSLREGILRKAPRTVQERAWPIWRGQTRMGFE
jgi:hypothetical protein